MTQIVVGDEVKVRYKSPNGWNEGYRLSGPVVEIKDNKVKVDLPFPSRDDGWYDIDSVVISHPLKMNDEERAFFDNTDYKSLDEKGQLAYISRIMESQEGCSVLAQAMLEPIKKANV